MFTFPLGLLFFSGCKFLFQFGDPLGPVPAMALLSTVSLLSITGFSTPVLKLRAFTARTHAWIRSNTRTVRRPDLRFKAPALQPMHQIAQTRLQVLSQAGVGSPDRDPHAACPVDHFDVDGWRFRSIETHRDLFRRLLGQSGFCF